MKVSAEGIVFLGCSGLFLLHQYLQRIAGVAIPACDSYLDPFLMMPILLQLVVWERRLLLRNRGYRLPTGHAAGYVALVAILAEGVFPLLDPKHVADFRDVGLYALGGIVHILIRGLAEGGPASGSNRNQPGHQ